MRLALAVLLTLGAAAHAEDLPIGAYGAVTCGSDDTAERELVVLPGGKVLEGSDAEDLTADATKAKAKAKLKKVVEGSTDRGGWCVGESTVTIGKQKGTFVVTGAGMYTGAGGDDLAPSVLMIARAVPDKDAAKLPAPPAITGKDDPGDWLPALKSGLATPEAQAALWAPKRTDLILVGSAPGEVFKGAAARTTLSKWKLKLALDGGLRTGTVGGSLEQHAYVYSNVVATPMKGGAPVTYRAFFLLVADHHDELDDDKRPAKDTWHLVLAHFAR